MTKFLNITREEAEAIYLSVSVHEDERLWRLAQTVIALYDAQDINAELSNKQQKELLDENDVLRECIDRLRSGQEADVEHRQWITARYHPAFPDELVFDTEPMTDTQRAVMEQF